MSDIDYDKSLTSHAMEIAAGDHVVAAAFLEGAPALALANGEIVFPGQSERRIAAHPDAGILVASADSRRFITGGDDGRIVQTTADGKMVELANEGGKWIDRFEPWLQELK